MQQKRGLSSQEAGSKPELKLAFHVTFDTAPGEPARVKLPVTPLLLKDHCIAGGPELPRKKSVAQNMPVNPAVEAQKMFPEGA